jgi:hypothetical protein
MGKPWVRGTVNDNSLLIESIPGFAQSIEVRIQRPDDFPYFLQISDRLLLDYEKPSLINTNDEDFNKRIFISALNITGATALMDLDTRKIIGTLTSITHFFTLEANKITFRIPYSLKDMIITEYKLRKALRYSIALINKLTRQENTGDLLSKNALSDPDAAIRRRNLELLISYLHFKNLKELLHKALHDQVKEIKYIAAAHLGQEGLPYLYKLFHNVSPENISLRIKIISSIARIQGTESMEFLMEYYKTLHMNEDKICIINLFKDYGDERVNDMLMEILKDDSDHELRLSVIQALGTCGTMKAVEPLYHISKQILLLPSLKNAAKRSISRIQSRFGSGDRGWLSIMDKDQSGGSLSLMETEDEEEE